MNFISESNPQIRALAREAAEQIKTRREAHNAEIQTIYQDFRSQADAIKAEASGDELDTRTADSLQTEQTAT
jgi:hypothetical protein